ncbi:hypothetical protein C1701_11940 [Actinoalloteichus sp. AHMU CJ021]|nr:hypothetical protein [Actinoalloteichus caeruleus]AUS78952.1 hypothetical protein C1701_11940 [Actinoalloteichus sp. AHMU CJ021]
MPNPPELLSPFSAPPGGVMTDEVGVITGDLELRTECDEHGRVFVWVRYAEADEWYRLGACEVTLHDVRDHEVLHRALLGALHRPRG